MAGTWMSPRRWVCDYYFSSFRQFISSLIVVCIIILAFTDIINSSCSPFPTPFYWLEMKIMFVRLNFSSAESLYRRCIFYRRYFSKFFYYRRVLQWPRHQSEKFYWTRDEIIAKVLVSHRLTWPLPSGQCFRMEVRLFVLVLSIKTGFFPLTAS